MISPTFRSDDSTAEMRKYLTKSNKQWLTDNCFDELNEESLNLLSMIYVSNKALKDKQKKAPHWVIILDDVGTNERLRKKDNILQTIAISGRHYNLS